MSKRHQQIEGYDTVSRSRRSERNERSLSPEPVNARRVDAAPSEAADDLAAEKKVAPLVYPKSRLQRSHVLSFAFLFIFTAVLYARPAEFYPSAATQSLALIIGLITLAVFLATQLTLEGKLTATPTEINLILLFTVAGLISIPFAIDPGAAWREFTGTFIRCIVIFVVMVNVVRTEWRLKALILLAVATGIWLSAGAINDYRLGLMTVEGYRAAGRGSGIFGNSNDMALFLVTLVPIAIVFAMQTRNRLKTLIFAGIAIMMIGGIVLTYSRGGFIGLLAATAFLAWRLGKKRRFEILAGGGTLAGVLLALSPSYALRLASIVMPSLDPVGSSEAREGELIRSLYVAIRHPLLGIGMGNYAPEMSYHGLVTHNSYTQVAAEMGAAALVCYLLFMVTPLRKLAQIARDNAGHESHFHYLAIGLQASLIGYMFSSFFVSVAYLWYVYYLVAYAVCFRRIYESTTGREVVIDKRRQRRQLTTAAPGELEAAVL